MWCVRNEWKQRLERYFSRRLGLRLRKSQLELRLYGEWKKSILNSVSIYQARKMGKVNWTSKQRTALSEDEIQLISTGDVTEVRQACQWIHQTLDLNWFEPYGNVKSSQQRDFRRISKQFANKIRRNQLRQTLNFFHLVDDGIDETTASSEKEREKVDLLFSVQVSPQMAATTKSNFTARWSPEQIKIV